MGTDGCCDNPIENRAFFGGMENSRLTSRFELTEHDSIVTEAREIDFRLGRVNIKRNKRIVPLQPPCSRSISCVLLGSLLYSCFSGLMTQ